MNPVCGRGRVTISAVIAPVSTRTQRQRGHHRDGERETEHQQAQAGPGQPHRANTRPGAQCRDRAELGTHHHRADDEHRGVGDHRDRREDRRQHQEHVVGHRRPARGVRVGDDVVPDHRVLRVPGREPLQAPRRRERRAARRRQHDPALLGHAEGIERPEQLAGGLARHVALEQVARRVEARAFQQHHVGDVVVVDQQLAHLPGQRGRHVEPDVDEHGRRVATSCRDPRRRVDPGPSMIGYAVLVALSGSGGPA